MEDHLLLVEEERKKLLSSGFHLNGESDGREYWSRRISHEGRIYFCDITIFLDPENINIRGKDITSISSGFIKEDWGKKEFEELVDYFSSKKLIKSTCCN